MVKVIIQRDDGETVEQEGKGACAIIDNGAYFGTMVQGMSIATLASCIASDNGAIKKAVNLARAIEEGKTPQSTAGRWYIWAAAGAVAGIILSRLAGWLPVVFR